MLSRVYQREPTVLLVINYSYMGISAAAKARFIQSYINTSKE